VKKITSVLAIALGCDQKKESIHAVAGADLPERDAADEDADLGCQQQPRSASPSAPAGGGSAVPPSLPSPA